MAIFRRRNNQPTVPEEIQEYYQTSQKQNPGMAWLLAIGTLIVTIVLALMIFFAGRWVWRQVFGNDSGTTDQTAQVDQRDSEENQSDDQDSENQPEDEADDNRDESENSGSQNNQDDDNQGPARTDDQEQPTTLPSGEEGTVNAPINGDGGRDSTPETGPGDTLAIFVGASALGYLLHRKYLLDRK